MIHHHWQHESHTTQGNIYSYYNVTIVTSFVQLLDDLIMAKLNTYDVFNTLDIMHDEFFLKDLTTVSMLQLNF
jgi:hypothetical protein